MAINAVSPRPRIVSTYGQAYPQENIRELVALFKLTVDAKMTEQKVRQRCFKAVLQVCLEGTADRVRELGPYIPGLRNKENRTVFEVFLDRVPEPRLTYILDAELHEVLDPAHSNEALHICVRQGRRMLFRQLAMYMNINEPDSKHLNPVHIAVEMDDIQTLDELLKLRQRPLLGIPVALDKLKCYLLAWAVICGAERCFDFLAEQREMSLNEYVEGIGNLLHLAIHFNQYEMLKRILVKDRFQTLLEGKDGAGKTPLIKAAQLGDVRSAALLLRHKAKIEATDDKHWTALHWAAHAGQRAVVDLLIYSEADVRCLTVKGEMPLHIATKKSLQDYLLCTAHGTVARGQAPQEKVTRPWTIVWEGGGPKGIAYVGAVNYLQKHHLLDEVTCFAGTSAGAITACLLALGYTAGELETILKEKSLMDFIDHPLTPERIINYVKNNVNGLGKLFNVFKKVSTLVSHGVNAASLNPVPLITSVLSKLWHCTGICEGETFRLWIEELSQKKTGVRYYTMGEHAQKVRAGGAFKHLHIFVTKLSKSGKEEILHLSSEDPKCAQYIISDCTRASMSIPGVFKPHHIYIKNEKGERVVLNPDETLVDGGMVYNLGINSFDFNENGRSIFNTHTLGFALASPSPVLEERVEDSIETVGQLLKSIAHVYFQAETLLRRMNPNNQQRVIEIDPKGVSALSFNLSKEKMDLLIRSGHEATSRFFDDELDMRSSWMLSLDLNRRDKKVVCNIPSSPVHFVGRGEALEQLRQFCSRGFSSSWRSSDKVGRLILTGEAGVGKSELAFNFILEQISHFSLAFWLDCSSEEALLASYASLAKELEINLKEPHDLGQVSAQISKHLETFAPESKPWILIFDNPAENLIWSKPQIGGFIITTTRTVPRERGADSLLTLPAFTKEEALRCLDRYHVGKDQPEQEILAETLAFNPLALSKAAAFIQEEDLSITAYLKALEDPKLLAHPVSDLQRSPLLGAAQLTLSALQKKLPLAWQFLNTKAHLLPPVLFQNEIMTWLEKTVGLRGPLLTKTVSDIVNTFKRYRILRYDAEKKELIIHPIIKTILQPTKKKAPQLLPLSAAPSSPQPKPSVQLESVSPAKTAPSLFKGLSETKQNTLLKDWCQKKNQTELLLADSCVDDKTLEELLKKSPQLQILDISNCPKLKPLCLKTIQKYCPALQTLKINRMPFEEIVLALPALRFFEFQSCPVNKLEILTQNPDFAIVPNPVNPLTNQHRYFKSIIINDGRCWVVVCTPQSLWKSKSLHHFALDGNLAQVREFGKLQASFEIQDFSGATALHLLLMMPPSPKRTEMVRYLVQEADPNFPLPATHPDYPLQSPTHLLVEKGETDQEIWKCLRRARTDFNQVDIANLTPLHRICERGNLQQIKLLLDIKEVDINALSPRGITALHIAAGRGYDKLVEELLRKGAQLEPLSCERETPFFSACMGNSPTVAGLLLDRGAKLNHQNSQGLSALHVICQFADVPILQYLLSKRINLNLQDNLGRSALHICVEKKRPGFGQELLKSGIDTAIKDCQGRTALDVARQKQDEGLIALLTRDVGLSIKQTV